MTNEVRVPVVKGNVSATLQAVRDGLEALPCGISINVTKVVAIVLDERKDRVKVLLDGGHVVWSENGAALVRMLTGAQP